MKSLIYLCLLLFFTSYSQDDKRIQDSIIRSNYITSVDEKMTVRSDISTSVTGYEFFDTKNNKKVHLIPNEKLKSTISVAYRKIELGVSFYINGEPFNDDDDLKGKTSTFGLNLGYISDKYVADVFYNRTEGFYVFNTKDYRTELDANNFFDKFIKTPKVKSKQIGIENSYFFNGKKYSAKFARNQSELQIKSAGSLVANFKFLYSELDGRNETFTYLPVFSVEGNNFRYQNENYYALAGLGYGYNYIITKHIYITAKLQPLIGFQYLNLKNDLNQILDKRTELILAATGELAAGGQYKNFFAGGFVKFGAFNNPLANNQLTSGDLFILGYLGYRFNTPKGISKFFDKVENIFKKK